VVRQSTPIVWRLPNAVGLSTVTRFVFYSACFNIKNVTMSVRPASLLRPLRCRVSRSEVIVRRGGRSYNCRATPCKNSVINASPSSLLTPLRQHVSRTYARQKMSCQTRTISSASAKHRVFIALGSNLGDRINMIEQACNLLDKHDEIKIVRTSCLWETKAMYVEDQADFLNGACEVGMLHRSALKYLESVNAHVIN